MGTQRQGPEEVDTSSGGGTGLTPRLCLRPQTIIAAAERVTGVPARRWHGGGRLIRCAVIHLCREHSIEGMSRIAGLLTLRSRTTCYADERIAGLILAREASGGGPAPMPRYLARHWPTFTAMVEHIYREAVDRIIGGGRPVGVPESVLAAECRAWRRMHPDDDFPERRVTDSTGVLTECSA